MSTNSLFTSGWLIANVCLFLGAITVVVHGDDWTRFRGPNGSGISQATGVPTQWSETQNLKWKTQLPGPGFSSPIVVGERMLVTCYTGYGMDREDPGQMEDLKRHLVCVARNNGEAIWAHEIPTVQPEDPYRGFITEHGYASHTPVSDGERVYVFSGKSGVIAFDLAGNQIWKTSVGTDSGRMKWGSAASPILSGNLVIVNASDQSQSLVALDKKTGQQVWRETAMNLGQNWSTPVLMDGQDGSVLVMTVLGEVWGRDPATGKLKWKVEGFQTRGYSASLASDDGVVYCSGGMLGGSSFALRIAGASAGEPPAFLWSGRSYESIISPLVYEGYVYGTTGRGIAYCLDAKSGERVYQARLSSGEAVADEPPSARGGGRGRPGSGRTGGRGRSGGDSARGGGRSSSGGSRRSGPGGGDYASPVYADGKIFVTTRSGVIYVLVPGPEFKILAKNQFASDQSDFCATPAILNDGIFIRSNKNLYCISDD